MSKIPPVARGLRLFFQTKYWSNILKTKVKKNTDRCFLRYPCKFRLMGGSLYCNKNVILSFTPGAMT